MKKSTLAILLCALLVLCSMVPTMSKKSSSKSKKNAKDNDRDGDDDDLDVAKALNDDADTQEKIRQNFIYLAEEVLELYPVYNRLNENIQAENIESIGLNLLNIFYKIDKIAADINIPLYKPENYYEEDPLYCAAQAQKIYEVVSASMLDGMGISLGLEAAMDISPLLPQAIFDCTGLQVERKYGEYRKKYARGPKVDRQSLE